MANPHALGGAALAPPAGRMRRLAPRGGRAIAAACALALVLLAPASRAQEPQTRYPADEPPQPPVVVEPGDSTISATDEEAPAREAHEEEEDVYGNGSEPYVMPPLFKALTDHIHNKIVHFPVALGLTALLFLILARRNPELEPAAHLLIWLAAVSAIAAYFSGQFAEKAFESSPKRWLAELHEKLGTATTLLLAGWAALTVPKRTQRWILPAGIVIALVIAVTGFYGGLLAHGH